MKITVLAIGDELLNGQVHDTNSLHIITTAGLYGFMVSCVRIIHDDFDDICNNITEALEKSDIVVTTGGLGPTRDDITKASLLNVFGGKLRRDIDVEKNIKRIFKLKGKALNQLTLDQALVPSTCSVIQNHVGTAPVMWFEKDDKILIALPGVPYEMKECWDNSVLPKLLQCFTPEKILISETCIVYGITESDLSISLNEFENSLPQGMHLAYLPQLGFIKLRLDYICNDDNDAEKIFNEEKKKLCIRLADKLVAVGDKTPAEIVTMLLHEASVSLSTAESCTGGKIAAAITAIPGCSNVYKGGIVAYDHSIKVSVLKVDDEMLNRYGAVSMGVVEQMCRGVAELTGSDYAVATSGIAGPSGGTPEKPVGTVCIGVRTPHEIFSRIFHFEGDRLRITERAAETALLMLADTIKKDKS